MCFSISSRGAFDGFLCCTRIPYLVYIVAARSPMVALRVLHIISSLIMRALFWLPPSVFAVVFIGRWASQMLYNPALGVFVYVKKRELDVFVHVVDNNSQIRGSCNFVFLIVIFKTGAGRVFWG